MPIKYINLITREKKVVSLVGGCKGVSIEDHYVYRPHFSYAIVDNKAETEKMKFYDKKAEAKLKTNRVRLPPLSQKPAYIPMKNLSKK